MNFFKNITKFKKTYTNTKSFFKIQMLKYY